jgi:hypothetical protein
MHLRPLNVIAAEIHSLWWNQTANKPRTQWPNFIYCSYPYLEAMLEMKSARDDYGLESGVFVVLYFLDNAHQWRGEDARRIKKELNQHVKEATSVQHNR